MAISQLFLIRHSETEMTKRKIVQGWINPGITAIGIEQAKKAVNFIQSAKRDGAVIVSSDLRRTTETAQIISKETNIPYIEKYDSFRERNLGELQGKYLPEAIQEFPNWFDERGFIKDFNLIPGAESDDQFIHRIRNGIDLVSNMDSEQVFVVTHSGIIRQFYNFIDPEKYNSRTTFPKIEYCSVHDFSSLFETV